MKKSSIQWLFVSIAVCLILSQPRLQADQILTSATLNFPLAPNLALPSWLETPTVETTGTVTTLSLPILPPEPADSLIITLLFQEKDGGFLRVAWSGKGGASELSHNLYENIRLTNQRSLLVPVETLQGQGTLMIQSGSAELGIKSIHLEWVKPVTSLVSPSVASRLVTDENGLTRKEDELDGQPPALEPILWKRQIVTTQLTDVPQRIEEGVEFGFELEQIPQQARLSFQENGLPFGQRVLIWINQHLAGTVSPGVPDLTDPGFNLDVTQYVGWRKGSLLVPFYLLKAGANALQFSTESDIESATSTSVPVPLAVKEVSLQLNYPAPIEPPTPSAPLLTPVIPPTPAASLTATL